MSETCRVFLALMMLATVSASGCVVLPPMGRRVGPEELGTIEVGVTTRHEASALLGEPTILDHPRFLLTDVEESAASILFVLGGPYQAAPVLVPLQLERHRVLLKFESDGRLTNASIMSLDAERLSSRAGETSERARLVGVRATAPVPHRERTLAGKLRKPPSLFSGWGGQELRRTFASVAYAPDGGRLAIGTTTSGVLLMDPTTGEIRNLNAGLSPEHATPIPNPVWVRTVAFSSDGRWLVTGGGEATVWDVADGVEARTFGGHGRPSFLSRNMLVTTVAYAPDGRRVASGDWKGIVKLWNPDTGKELLGFKAHDVVVTSLAFSPDGSILASAQWGKSVRLWDVATGRRLATSDRGTYDVLSAAFSPDGRRLAVHAESHVEVWRISPHKDKLAELEQVFLLPYPRSAHWGTPPCIVFSPDGDALGAINDAATLIYLRDGTMTPPFAPNSRAAAFSPDGRYLVTVGENGVHVWEVHEKTRP